MVFTSLKSWFSASESIEKDVELKEEGTNLIPKVKDPHVDEDRDSITRNSSTFNKTEFVELVSQDTQRIIEDACVNPIIIDSDSNQRSPPSPPHSPETTVETSSAPSTISPVASSQASFSPIRYPSPDLKGVDMKDDYLEPLESKPSDDSGQTPENGDSIQPNPFFLKRVWKSLVAAAPRPDLEVLEEEQLPFFTISDINPASSVAVVETDSSIRKAELSTRITTLLFSTFLEVICEAVAYYACRTKYKNLNLLVWTPFLFRMIVVLFVSSITLYFIYYGVTLAQRALVFLFAQKVTCSLSRVCMCVVLISLVQAAIRTYKLPYHIRYTMIVLILGLDGVSGGTDAIVCVCVYIKWRKRLIAKIRNVQYFASIVIKLLKTVLAGLTCSDMYFNNYTPTYYALVSSCLFVVLMFTRYMFHRYGEKFCIDRVLLRDFTLYCFVYFCCLIDLCKSCSHHTPSIIP